MEETAVASLNEINYALELFSKEVKEALHENFISIILYGGLAKGEFTPETSDINIMIVLKDASLEKLKQLAPVIQKENTKISLQPFTRL